MYTPSRNLSLASGIALALAGISTAGAGDATSNDVTEARQETQIWTTYALSPYLRANDLKVSVDDGKATLTGTVEEDVNRDLAKQIALGVGGIETVDNQIRVQADYAPARRDSGRSYAEVVDDATITAAVKSKLLWSKRAEGMVTNVDTSAGRVTLSGNVDSIAASEHAQRLAMNTDGVRSVDNKLVVGTAKPAGAAPAKYSGAKADAKAEKAAKNEPNSDVSDTWITTKVKSTFMYSTNVDGSDIEVSTKDGIVTLSGKLASGAERALAVELANNVRGVRSVQSKGLTI